MLKNALFAVALIQCFTSIALSQTPEFDLNSLNSEAQTRLLNELMATNGVDQQDIIDQIQSAKALGMNQFDYKRYYDEEVVAIQNAPSLWREGESVTLRYSAIAQLQNYDFDEGVNYFCVPTMLVPINTSRDGIWPPNVQIVFGPSNSTPGNGARAGQRCDPPGSLWDSAGKGVFDFNRVRIKMNPDQAEKLYEQTLSSTLGVGGVNFSVTCTVGPGTENGAYCSVVSGSIGIGTNEFALEEFDVSAIRAAEEAAVASAAEAEAERLAQLPPPSLERCPAGGTTMWASRYPNCELITFTDASQRYTRKIIGDATGRSFCPYIEPKGGDITWEWKADWSVDIFVEGTRLPASAVAFEIPVGESYSGFLCGYQKVTSSVDTVSSILQGLGDKAWGGSLLITGKKPIKVLLQADEAAVKVGYPEHSCFGQWTVGNTSSAKGPVRESFNSGQCVDGNFIRLQFSSATQLVVEIRKRAGDNEPFGIAVLQPEPLFKR